MYVKLKQFRTEHGRIRQTELADIIGVKQSVLSRMENMHSELSDTQYSLLVARYGEEEVGKYVSENPAKNVLGVAMRKKEGEEQNSIIAALVDTVKTQAITIEQMRQKIEELTQQNQKA